MLLPHQKRFLELITEHKAHGEKADILLALGGVKRLKSHFQSVMPSEWGLRKSLPEPIYLADTGTKLRIKHFHDVQDLEKIAGHQFTMILLFNFQKIEAVRFWATLRSPHGIPCFMTDLEGTEIWPQR